MVFVVRARKHWDVKCPPVKKHMVAGTLVPTVRGSFGTMIQKKRRIVVEIIGSDAQSVGSYGSSDSHDLTELRAEERVVVRILKPRRHWGLSRDHDDSDDDETDEEHGMKDEGGWIEYRKFDLDDIDQDLHIHKTSFETKFGRGNDLEVREIKFPSEQATKDFVAVLTRLWQQQAARAEEKLRAFKSSQVAKNLKSNTNMEQSSVVTKDVSVENDVHSPSELLSTTSNEDINLLVEIVSATDLPIADIISSDPYVVVWMGKTEVHRTMTIKQTTDPIWTVATGSLFILSTTSQDFFQSSDGLTFLVKDYDSVGSNEVLGKISIPQDELLEAKGERVEYVLDVMLEGFDPKKAVYPPKLNIRVRPASQEDFVFLKTLHAVKKMKKLGVYAEAAFVAPLAHKVTRLKRETKHTANGPLHRIKPGPDPDREEKLTKWMSDKQIEDEHMKPSTRWIESGSGKIGRLYLEVLRCDGLPNMDSGAMGDLTDAFCSIIYEDTIVNTDVINDELDPRWMPWSQRAFIFHMEHPSSEILVGVFDYDQLRSDPIGRVTIDITNFCEKVDYVLTYTLYQSVLDEIRQPQGTLTVRLRLEFGNFREAVLASLGPPGTNYVNVAKKDDFLCARFVVQGEENLNRLDMDALKSYGKELEGYADLQYYIEQAVLTVLLWRGHYEVQIFRYKFKLALHSIVAFVMAVCLVENFDLFPSFFLLSIAWFFLATNEQRQRNPSPWHQSATFGALWYAFLTGTSVRREILSADAELQPLIQKYDAELEERRQKKQERIAKTQEHLGKMNTLFLKEEQEVNREEEDLIETKTGRMQLNPLKPILMPIQKILGQVCTALRIVRSIVTWDESVYAFILTNACLVGGIALLFVPWSWLIRWTLRVLVWTFLGPWMKLIDWFVVKKLEEEGDNFAKRLEMSMEQRSLVLLMKKRLLMIRKEDALKLVAMKRYMFGRFIARIPQFKQYRFPDVPLPQSSAKARDSGYSSVHIVERKHGQKLVGHMIPKWGDSEDDAMITAKAKADPGILSRTNPVNLFWKAK